MECNPPKQVKLTSSFFALPYLAWELNILYNLAKLLMLSGCLFYWIIQKAAVFLLIRRPLENIARMQMHFSTFFF